MELINLASYWFNWTKVVNGWEAEQSHPNLHTTRSSIHIDIYQMSYWYN